MHGSLTVHRVVIRAKLAHLRIVQVFLSSLQISKKESILSL